MRSLRASVADEHPVVIGTERLLLREYERADWAAVHRYASDPAVVRYMWWGPYSDEETRTFVGRTFAQRRCVPRVDLELAVTLRDGGALVGGCSLNLRRARDATWEVGYCFTPEVWGRGYATEAVTALVDHGFRRMQVRRVYGLVDPENLPSVRVLEHLAFRYEGHLVQHTLIRGEYRDSLIYARLASE